jgi:hypothetical protein
LPSKPAAIRRARDDGGGYGDRGKTGQRIERRQGKGRNRNTENEDGGGEHKAGIKEPGAKAGLFAAVLPSLVIGSVK